MPFWLAGNYREDPRFFGVKKGRFCFFLLEDVLEEIGLLDVDDTFLSFMLLFVFLKLF
jgi:hypothetical protein